MKKNNETSKERKTEPVAEKVKKGRPSKKGIFSVFQNNKFTMCFSVLLAMVFWLMMAFTNTEDFPVAVRSVSVTVRLPQSAQESGLTVFTPQEQTITVYIKGNSLSVHTVTKDDLQVETQFSQTINGAGTYLATPSVKKVGYITDFEIDHTEPSTILVSLDYLQEKTFTVDTSEVIASGADGYFSGTPTANPATVKVSGPKTLVDSIASVRVGEKSFSSLTESTSFNTGLLFLDANGNALSADKLQKLTISATTADVTIPVLVRKTLPLTLNFTNRPTGFSASSPRFSLSPSYIEVAGSPELFESITSIDLDPIDFSQITLANNQFQLPVTLPSGLRNLQGVESVELKVNLSGYSSRVIEVEDFRFTNIPEGVNPTMITSSIQVSGIGPEEEVEGLTSSNLYGQINLAGREGVTGHTEVPVTFSISGSTGCWVAGSYRANISIEPRE